MPRLLVNLMTLSAVYRNSLLRPYMMLQDVQETCKQGVEAFRNGPGYLRGLVLVCGVLLHIL